MGFTLLNWLWNSKNFQAKHSFRLMMDLLLIQSRLWFQLFSLVGCVALNLVRFFSLKITYTDISISLRWYSRSHLQNQWSTTSYKKCHLLELLTSYLHESVSLRSLIFVTHIFNMMIPSLFQMWQKSNKITYLTRESCIFHLEKN